MAGAAVEWEGGKITLQGPGRAVGGPGLGRRVRAKVGQVRWSGAKRAVRWPLQVSEGAERGVIGKGRWADTSLQPE